VLSLRILRVAREIWPPPRTRSRTALCSAFSSSGMICGSSPTTSGAVQPNIRSAAGFHSITVWSVPKATIASGAHSITARAVTSVRLANAPAGSAVTSNIVPRQAADGVRPKRFPPNGALGIWGNGFPPVRGARGVWGDGIPPKWGVTGG